MRVNFVLLLAGLVLLAVSAACFLWSWPGETPTGEGVSPGPAPTPQENETQPQQPAGGPEAPPESPPEGSVQIREYDYIVREAILLKNGLDMEKEDLVYVVLPRNDTYQQAFLLESNYEPERIGEDEEGNVFAVFRISLRPEERAWINMTFRVVVRSYRIDLDYSYAHWPPYEVVSKYTSGTLYWNVKNETIRKIAERVAGELQNPAAIAEELAAWVSSHVQYEPRGERSGADRAIMTVGGEEKIVGDCSEVADVYVTMARYLGLPARSVYGFLLEDVPQVYWLNTSIEEEGEEILAHWGGHTWPQVYIPPWGWIDVEMLEGFVPKVGDYSWRHILFAVESRRITAASLADAYVDTWYFNLEYLRLEVELGG